MITVAQIPVARLLGQINLVRWYLQFRCTQLWNLLYNSLMAHRYMKGLLALDINLSNRNESQLLWPPLVFALKSSGCHFKTAPKSASSNWSVLFCREALVYYSLYILKPAVSKYIKLSCTKSNSSFSKISSFVVEATCHAGTDEKSKPPHT